MTSLTALSQDIVIKRSVLESMYKESRICDSLKVAYELKSEALAELIESNEQTNLLLVDEREASKEYQQQIKELNKTFARTRKRNFLVYTASGIIGGILLKSLVLK